MRRVQSQAGNRARKTCRRGRRGEHTSELGAGSPKVLLVWDRRAPSFGSPLAAARCGSIPQDPVSVRSGWLSVAVRTRMVLTLSEWGEIDQNLVRRRLCDFDSLCKQCSNNFVRAHAGECTVVCHVVYAKQLRARTRVRKCMRKNTHLTIFSSCVIVSAVRPQTRGTQASTNRLRERSPWTLQPHATCPAPLPRTRVNHLVFSSISTCFPAYQQHILRPLLDMVRQASRRGCRVGHKQRRRIACINTAGVSSHLSPGPLRPRPPAGGGRPAW